MINEIIKNYNIATYQAQINPDDLLCEFRLYQAKTKFEKIVETLYITK